MKRLEKLFAALALVFVLANAAALKEGVIYPWVVSPPLPSKTISV